MTVYIDVLFLYNFLPNLLILSASAALLRDDGGILKMISGAAVMSIYSIVLLLPLPGILLGIVGKLLFLLLFSTVYFRCGSMTAILKSSAVIVTVTAVFGGIMYAAANMFPDLELGLLPLSLCCIAATGLIVAMTSILNKRHAREFVRSIVTADGTEYRLNILIDTGCELKEPLSRKPIIIAEGTPYTDGCAVLSETVSGNNILYIRKVECSDSNGNMTLRNCYIGFVNKKLSGDGSYNAIASPEAFCLLK